ncbi:MAG: hypothetical protein M3254_00070 [Actinomycetota bacterium]|nr:hypothetical protein [Actinomycetota bacterium]
MNVDEEAYSVGKRGARRKLAHAVPYARMKGDAPELGGGDHEDTRAAADRRVARLCRR